MFRGDSAVNQVVGEAMAAAPGVLPEISALLLREGDAVRDETGRPPSTYESDLAALLAAEQGTYLGDCLQYGAYDARGNSGTVASREGTTGIQVDGREAFRIGPSGRHGIEGAHVHPRFRNQLPDGTLREGVSGRAVEAQQRHIRDLYRALEEGTFRTSGGR